MWHYYYYYYYYYSSLLLSHLPCSRIQEITCLSCVVFTDRHGSNVLLTYGTDCGNVHLCSKVWIIPMMPKRTSNFDKML